MGMSCQRTEMVKQLGHDSKAGDYLCIHTIIYFCKIYKIIIFLHPFQKESPKLVYDFRFAKLVLCLFFHDLFSTIFFSLQYLRTHISCLDCGRCFDESTKTAWARTECKRHGAGGAREGSLGHSS